MKIRLHILVFVMAVSMFPLLAADSDNGTLRVERRFHETDISLALRQYERVQMEAFEANLKLVLLDTESAITESQRKEQQESLKKRIEILRKYAEELRESAHTLGKQLAAMPQPVASRPERSVNAK